MDYGAHAVPTSYEQEHIHLVREHKNDQYNPEYLALILIIKLNIDAEDCLTW